MNENEEIEKLFEIKENIKNFFLVQYIFDSIFSLFIANIIIFNFSPSFMDNIYILIIAEIFCSVICFCLIYLTFPIRKKVFNKNKYMFLKNFDNILESIKNNNKTIEDILIEYDID